MGLTVDDRVKITELIYRHGHLVDSGDLDRMHEVFTADVTYDVSAYGGEPLHGLDGLKAAALALGNGNPVGHHVTNVTLTEVADGEVRALSKGIGVMADGTCGSVTYEDTVLLGERGWRISHRTIIPHRSPLGRS